ncbi:MAG TPA: excinuclease ABC subunit UvrA, partial [Dissulfurispiraceae bacterium]
SDSIEMAWKEGKERIKIVIFKAQDQGQPEKTEKKKRSQASSPATQTLRFSSKNTCDYCNISLPEPTPIFFSFNHPISACPECKGFGNILIYDEDLIVPERNLTLSEGAIELWEKPGYKWWKDQMVKGARKSGVSLNIPYEELPKEAKDTLFKGNEHFYGINNFFEELENKRYKLHVRILLSRYRSPKTCPKCGGKRLCKDALSYKIDGMDIARVSDLPVAKLSEWLKGLELSPMQQDIAKEPVRQILLKLHFLERVGLAYLTLTRQAKTLSGGEYQRVSLSNQLASALTGTLYVLDEPTIGLHPRDTRRIVEIMKELSSRGNTIIVVEHDKDIISMSDWVVELGPGGGHLGGEVVFSGPMTDFLKSETLTARFIRGNGNRHAHYAQRPASADMQNNKDYKLRTADYSLLLKGASGNNLKNVNLRLPLEALTVISGVSGSGKSSLIVETLFYALARHFRLEPEQPLPYKTMEGVEKIKGVRLIDQSPIGKTPRSNLSTYLKIFDAIRKLFSQQQEAKAHGYSPGFFSFNIPGGRCEACSGEGYQRMEMYFFEDVFVRCEECKGRRYKSEALRVKYKGKDISEVLALTVDEAFDFFYDIVEIRTRLDLMRDIGLGYLKLGQSATTFSGGEAQRLKICAELSVNSRPHAWGTLYILDEPTVGLHHSDVMMFMKIIRRLVDTGNTVVIIEHNLDVIGQADWVVDLGPEGGDQGGKIIFEGTPKELRSASGSFTGEYLKEYETGLS